MLPTVFLSLSGSDADFVNRVYKILPDGLAYYYPKSFENGENLVTAMESRISLSTIFVLFASRRSLESAWVGFEIDRARIAKIQNKNLRVLVFPIERGITVGDLPHWMQEYWIGSAGLSSRDISRYIRNMLLRDFFDSLHSSQVFGRGGLIDQATGNYLNATVLNQVRPNVIVFGGHEGIGRRTVAKELLRRIHPGSPEITFGPEFYLPQFADLEDIYRSLRQEISDGLTMEQMSEEGAQFRSLNQDSQIEEVCRCISYYAALKQAIWIVSGNGIFEDRGTLKSWVLPLFSKIGAINNANICIISNRLIHNNEARPISNLLQVSVGEISDSDIRSVIIAVSSDFGGTPVLPGNQIVTGIGGHPQVAKIAARIIATQGPSVLDHDPKKLYDIQDEILGSSIDLGAISVDEQKILSVLSWVPQLSSELLSEVIIGKEGVGPSAFSDCLSNLERGCMIQSVGSNYSIAAPIRLLFRRKYGYGSEQLRASFASVLKEAGDKAIEGEQVKTDLIDALLFMASIEGGTLDPAFRHLLLPSSLQSVIQAAYDSRWRDDTALERVIAWGSVAKTMKMDEGTREEILSYVIRAQCRLNKKSDAEQNLSFIDAKLYRSRHYLRSFYIRHCGGRIVDAISHLKEAYKVKKYMQAVVADLALCYQKEGRWNDLFQLLESEGDRADKNAGLLDVKAGIQITRREFPEAEITIRKLNNHPLGDGRATSRTAMLMMHRDHNYSGAQAFLTKYMQETKMNSVPTRRLRAIAAAYAGDRSTVEHDIDFLRSKPDGLDTVCRIQARLLLTEGAHDEALDELSKVKRSTHQDGLLRARILESKSEDAGVPLISRKELRSEVQALRASHGIISEFELD